MQQWYEHRVPKFVINNVGEIEAIVKDISWIYFLFWDMLDVLIVKNNGENCYLNLFYIDVYLL